MIRETCTEAAKMTKVQFKQIIVPLATVFWGKERAQSPMRHMATAKIASETNRHRALSQIEISNSQKMLLRSACSFLKKVVA